MTSKQESMIPGEPGFRVQTIKGGEAQEAGFTAGIEEAQARGCRLRNKRRADSFRIKQQGREN